MPPAAHLCHSSRSRSGSNRETQSCPLAPVASRSLRLLLLAGHTTVPLVVDLETLPQPGLTSRSQLVRLLAGQQVLRQKSSRRSVSGSRRSASAGSLPVRQFGAPGPLSGFQLAAPGQRYVVVSRGSFDRTAA